MVTVEISTGLLVVLLLSGIIFLMMEYWFARCDVRRYQQWCEDMRHKWSVERHENIELKEQFDITMNELIQEVLLDFCINQNRGGDNMLHAGNIEYLWKHREEYINVQGVLLDEEQTRYLIEVLRECRIPHDECYLRTLMIISACLDSQTRDVPPVECARQLEKENKMVMEHA